MDTSTHKTLTQLGRELATAYEQFEEAYKAFTYRVRNIQSDHSCCSAKHTATIVHRMLTVGLGGLVLVDSVLDDPLLKRYVPLTPKSPRAVAFRSNSHIN